MPVYRFSEVRGFVLDRATGRKVPDLIQVDTDRGEAEQLVRDWLGSLVAGRYGDPKTRLLRGSFLFVRDADPPRFQAVE